MPVKIDNINRTCVISQNGETHHSMLADAIITTDKNEHRPVLEIKGARTYITEAQMISLINGGATDERGRTDASD
ncbi:DUF3203 family protein [Stutzerimonas nitrititolerans]|uniref:DUF3203 family protein n=1 Tax=Stutzerimonas nitrititolerans TaxID=2482751 RepID=UPI0028A096D6|nr:DUF3203 family protein [Stutzerimonas nitrititolerans]